MLVLLAWGAGWLDDALVRELLESAPELAGCALSKVAPFSMPVRVKSTPDVRGDAAALAAKLITCSPCSCDGCGVSACTGELDKFLARMPLLTS